MAKAKKKTEEKMSAKMAMDICDDMDLPDGAYWAMVEELSGCEPADCIEYDDED